MPTRSTSHITARLLAFLAIALAWSSRGAAAQDVRPLETRIDVVMGRTLVLPVELEDERDARKFDFQPRLDDGRAVATELFWIGVTPRPLPDSGPGWLSQPYEWSAIPAAIVDPAARPNGGWWLVVELPLDAIGQGMWFDRTRYEINWLPDPITIAANEWLAGEPPKGLWEPTAPAEARRSLDLAGMARAEASSPTRRWRARLMLDGLRPAGRLGQRSREDPVRAADDLALQIEQEGESGRVIEALARQFEARWQVALGWLWLADPATHWYVCRQLAGVAQFETAWAPAWEAGTLPSDDLLRDMLDPFVGGETKAMLARAWADAGSRALAWVVDDGGKQDAVTGGLLPSIGVVSLPKSDRSIAIAVEGPRALPALEPTPNRAMRLIPAGLAPPRGSAVNPAAPTALVRVRSGQWSTEFDVVAGVIPIKPPGLRIGPLYHDWTLAALAGGREAHAALPPDSRRTAAMLSKSADPTESDTGSGWSIYIECALPGGDEVSGPPEQTDVVRVWLGAYGQPSAVLRVTPDGVVRDEVAEARGLPSSGGATAEVVRSDDRWSVRVNLPGVAVDDAGVLRIGVERTDGWGRRTAWPRRMLPWQREPGRIAIDAAGWDGLGSE